MRARAVVGAGLVALLVAPLVAGEPKTPLFEDAAESLGLANVNGSRVTLADLDGDGWPELIVHSSTAPIASSGVFRIFHNEHGHFVERDAGGLDVTRRRADIIQVADVNDDGQADLFYGRSTDVSRAGFVDDGLRSELWLGDGKTFALREGAGLGAHAETTVGACFVDYDRDGILDLFVGNQYVAYGKSLEAYPSRLYRGKGDGTFEDVTEKAGLLLVAEAGRPDSRRPTYGVTHADWDDDGLQDLFQLSYGRQANRLWRNKGDGTFEDVAVRTTFDGDADRSGKYSDDIKKRLHVEDEQTFRSHGNTFDCAIADFDGDGDLDCFLAEITHWWAGPSSDLSMLLVNKGPAGHYEFERRPDLVPRERKGAQWNQGDLHAGWLDADGDGLLDLVVASSDYPDEQILRLWHQKPDHTFEEWTDRLGFRFRNACQISFGDVDGDGATDIVIATNDMRLTPEQKKEHGMRIGVFRNVCARANGFFALRLSGGGAGHSNRDAIGAKVTIKVGEQRQTRIVQGGLGHAGHRDDLDCRFGVGKATKVDSVEVRWPDAHATVQTFTDVPVNKFYALVEGGKLVEGRAPPPKKKFF